MLLLYLDSPHVLHVHHTHVRGTTNCFFTLSLTLPPPHTRHTHTCAAWLQLF
jgi:hypothetical protein